MACGGCGKKTGERATIDPLTRGIRQDRAATPPAGMVEIVYGGTIGNHFVYSPTRRTNGQRLRYGYYSRGDHFFVYEEDAAERPDLFQRVVDVMAEAVTDEPEAEDADDVMWADDVAEVEAAFPAVEAADDFTVLPWVNEEQAVFFLEELKVLTFAELAALAVREIQRAPGLGAKRAAEVQNAARERA